MAKDHSETRWWSKWEVYQQILMKFGDIERLLIEAEATNVGPQLLPQLQAIFSDPERLINLKFELAIAIDVGEHFVKAKYFLEGDGPLVLSFHEKFHAVARACQDPTFLTCMQSRQRSLKKILPKT